MKIIKFKLKTKDGEVVNLEEVDSLSFGIPGSDHFENCKDLFITCKQGQLRFDTEDIVKLSFNIEQSLSYLEIKGC